MLKYPSVCVFANLNSQIRKFFWTLKSNLKFRKRLCPGANSDARCRLETRLAQRDKKIINLQQYHLFKTFTTRWNFIFRYKSRPITRNNWIIIKLQQDHLFKTFTVGIQKPNDQLQETTENLAFRYFIMILTTFLSKLAVKSPSMG